MSKKYYITPILVIVESPAKCQKIQQYLGNGYKVIASYGHLRELTSLKDIHLENNKLKLNFNVINNVIKKKQVTFIRNEIKQCDEVILASDSDREGEAIAWHICDLFNLDVSTCKRIVFNEITETAIQHAIKNPKTIDMNLVYAQQARQVLDLLVGFKISPVLWKFLTYNAKNSLSAGRCQTPALKLIHDNQLDINNSEERKVYNTSGYFTSHNICFDLNKQLEKELEIQQFLKESIHFAHKYSCTKPSIVSKSPPEPFITSKLQQTISNELRYSPKETMKICQSLYEAGYITYMRTDSKTYSKDFIEIAKLYIVRNYEHKYIRTDIDSLVSDSKEKEKEKEKEGKQSKSKKTTKENKQNKSTITQDAHEAIRPTDISLKELDEKINSKERKVYKIIWENTLESCMSCASFYSIKATISAAHNTIFQKTSEFIHFPGWKIVKRKYETTNKEYQILLTIPENTIVKYNKINAKVTITNSKQHYTEAKLIQLLEEKGIGRPSTYSMIIDKIQDREYVKKEDVKGKEIDCKDFELSETTIHEIVSTREFGNEKNKLIIQPLGTLVITFLEKHFNDLFNYEYTKNMEDELDKIAKGLREGHELCIECNNDLEKLISDLKCEKKIEFKLDENNTYIVGKYGPVIQCKETIDNKEVTHYKPIKKDIDIQKLENGEYSVEDIVANNTNNDNNNSHNVGNYENQEVFIKKGKYGLYIVWGDNSKTLKDFGNRDIQTISFEEVLPYLESGTNIIREITKDISIRKGPKGHYIYYKTNKMKKPKFFDIKKFQPQTDADYITCDVDIFKSWCKNTYNI
jgi:DNA topoisomerase-1